MSDNTFFLKIIYPLEPIINYEKRLQLKVNNK